MKSLLLTTISCLFGLMMSSGLTAQCAAAPGSITITPSGTIGTALTVAFTPTDLSLSGDEYVVPVRVSDGNIVGDPVCVSESNGTFFFTDIVVRRTLDCYSPFFGGKFIDFNPTCPADRDNDNALATIDEAGTGNYEGFAFVIYDPANAGEFFVVTNNGGSFSGNDSGTLPGFSNELPTSSDPSTPPSTTITPGPPVTSIDDAQTVVSGGVLPVTLTAFKGSLLDKAIMLSWETTSESDNDFFEVQRANPATGEFESIGQVTGAGSSEQVNNYAFEDRSYGVGENLYRLRQMDFDGTSTLSEVISVRVSTGSSNGLSLEAFPNPASDRINLRTAGLAGETARVELFASTGRLIRTHTVGSASAQLEVSDLPAGVYQLRLLDGKAQVTTRLVVR